MTKDDTQRQRGMTTDDTLSAMTKDDAQQGMTKDDTLPGMTKDDTQGGMTKDDTLPAMTENLWQWASDYAISTLLSFTTPGPTCHVAPNT